MWLSIVHEKGLETNNEHIIECGRHQRISKGPKMITQEMIKTVHYPEPKIQE